MNITDKLGITPGPWIISDKVYFDSFISGDTGKYENVICQSPASHTNSCKSYEPWHKNKNLITAAPEMLEALIHINEFIDVYEAEIETLSSSTPSVEKIGLLIEKATGKPWEEIKKLMGES